MFNNISESITVAIILVCAMLLVGYLIKFQTNWIAVCRVLGFSSKEKSSVILAKIKELKILEDESMALKYFDAKNEFDL